MRFPHCDAPNHPYATFCIACGEPLVAGAPPAAPELSRPPRLRLAQIGVALAVGAVLVWLLGSWVQDESHAASYRGGTAALAAHDWARAASQFHAAAPYADAATRATRAEQTLREQMQLAHAAEYAGLSRDWLALLPILDRLLQIDPTDAGAQRQRTIARKMLLAQELRGTLYLIAGGTQAGLYANTEVGRDIRLPGSDGQSRPRAISPDGTRLVYDRPRRDPNRPAGTGAKGVREAVLATFRRTDGLPGSTVPDAVTTQVLPPIISAGLTGEFVPGGLFWQTYSADEGLPGGSLLFYRFADGHTIPIRASGQWRYVAATSESSGWSLLVVPPALGPDLAVSRLTLGRPGDPPLLDRELPGWMTAAEFSPDGQYVLFAMQDGSISTSLSNSIQFIRLRRRAFDGTIGAELGFLFSITSAGPNPPQLAATLVPDGQGSGPRVLLSLRDGEELSFILTGLEDGIPTSVWTGRAPHRIATQAVSDDGRWLAYVAEEAEGAHLVLQGLQENTAPQSLASAGLRDAEPSLQFAPGSRFLIYQTPGPAEEMPGALYSVALASAPVPHDSPIRPVHLGTVAPAGESLPTLAPAPGGALALYVDPAQVLHAAAYDGALDLLLDDLPGPVAAVWSLQRR